MLRTGVIKNILTDKEFLYLKNHFINHELMGSIGYDDHGRKLIHSSSDQVLVEYSNKLLPLVKDFFEDQEIEPTYSMYAEYSDKTIDLHKHKDLNACQYTVDLVIHQTSPWSLWIEGFEYSLSENEAVLFCGEDQLHWRETVEDNSDVIGVVFFHYVSKDHWWFEHGPEYVEVVRQRARERIANA
jgi:hypothetical protein